MAEDQFEQHAFPEASEAFIRAAAEVLSEDAETCPAGGGDHDWRDERERYGEDADGNRGTWLHFKRCTKCGDER